MIRVFCALAALLLCAVARGDTPNAPAPAAVIEGSVINDGTGEPLGRAQVLFQPMSAGASSVVIESDERGGFLFYGLKPGTYSVQVTRDGYLPVSHAMRGSWRMPPYITVEEGARMRDLTFRLKRWSVIAGKVKFDTGEPGTGLVVQVLRQSFIRNRRGFVLVTTGRTNDLGEYRIAGLAHGDYFLAATYNRTVPQDAIAPERTDDQGHPVPDIRYATTLYPSATRLSDAVPVHVNDAQEVGGIDIYLKAVPTVRLRGRVISGANGKVLPGGSVSLRRLGGSEGASVNVPITVRPYEDGFEMRGVTAGPYMLTAETYEAGVRFSAARPLLVTDAPIDNIDLALASSKDVHIEVRTEAGKPDSDPKEFDPKVLRITLEPRSELNPVASATPLGSSGWRASVAAQEVYDVFVANTPADYYLKSVRVGGDERLGSGYSGWAASPNVPVEITLAADGGWLAGRVYSSDGRPATGASVMAVPEAGPARPQWYRPGSADENGVFDLRGLAPGRYTIFAWYDDPPCEFYDSEALPDCRTSGRSVTVSENSQAVVEIRLAP